MLKPLTCFIIMPFDDRFLPVRNVIRKVVGATNRGRAIRSDDIFRPGNVVDQLKDAIQHADFCVADVTENNPNVMWEIGYAAALQKPVIAIRQHSEQIPFDVRQERFFNYELDKISAIRPTLAKAVKSVVADLASRTPFLAWRYDELAVLKQKLARCRPHAQGKDLLQILTEAMKRPDQSLWQVGDEERLMKSIASITGKVERTDCFWWLIVYGVFVFGQINRFQVRGSVAYGDNLELVKFSDRGIALLNLLSEEATHATEPGENGSKLREEEFFRRLEAYSPEQAEVARRILEWSKQRFSHIDWQPSSFVPVYEYGSQSSHNPLTVYGYAKTPRVQVKFGRMKTQNGFSDEMLKNLLKRLNEINGVSISQKKIHKYPTIPISALTNDKALSSFLSAIEWTLETIKASHGD